MSEEKPVIVEEKEVVPVIDHEKAEEIIEQFEGATRTLKNPVGLMISCIAVGLSVFALYGAVAIVPQQYSRSIHLGIALVLVFLLYPAVTKDK